MCGIIGAISSSDVSQQLLNGLKHLEYRGYDSAGIAVHDQAAKQIRRTRSKGKVDRLIDAALGAKLNGCCGIAHTRWATHGAPNETNAHPHQAGQTVIVHNGIIENHESLREALQKRGRVFQSETDSEVIAHLIDEGYQAHHNGCQAIQDAIAQLEGAYSLGVLFEDEPNALYGVCHGSPLVVGMQKDGHCLSSDKLALIGVAHAYLVLRDGDIAILSREKVSLIDASGKSIEARPSPMHTVNQSIGRGDFRHFMLKEIFEQPSVLSDALEGRLSEAENQDQFSGISNDWLSTIEHIHIAACGTSYHAGLVAKYWFESMAQIPCHVEVASELRYRSAVVSPNTCLITISQSGETADTLAALRQAKTMAYTRSLAICNVNDSALIRESDDFLLTRAGIEVGVASTKAFTSQLTVLLALTIHLAGLKKKADLKTQRAWRQALRQLPIAAEHMLRLNPTIQHMAKAFHHKHHALFLGRGVHYPIALEGALKLKEISYIHAEGYPAGELKHGPLALVDEEMPVVVMAPNNQLLNKLKSNCQEVAARGGRLFVFTDIEAVFNDPLIRPFRMPAVNELIAPIVHTIPLQLLAYHVAVLRGTDVDQPRNLAKSVTVE